MDMNGMHEQEIHEWGNIEGIGAISTSLNAL